MVPANNKVNKIAFLFMAVLLAPTLYWAFTYSGPYRYLAELQLKWMGVYYPELTGGIILLGMLLCFVFIKILFRGAERPVPGASEPPTPLQQQVLVPAQLPWMRFLPYVVAPIFFFLGANDYYKGLRAGHLQDLDAKEFYGATQQPSVLYAQVHGRLGDRYLSQDDYFYVAMTVVDQTTGTVQPVQLLVGGNKAELKKAVRRNADGTFQVWGFVEKGLAGDVKYAFEKEGYKMGDAIWVIHAGRDPAYQKGQGLFVMGFGVACVGIVYLVIKIRDRKRRPAAKPVQVTA